MSGRRRWRSCALAFGIGRIRGARPDPPAFGDEGAANHMRLSPAYGEPGVEVFVYGVSGGAFPARQHLEASKAIARQHGLDPARMMFAEQSEDAIAAGAFHNDVVAVANERVLFAHEKAFADKAALVGQCRHWSRALNMSKCLRPRCRSPMPCVPTCSMPSS